MHTMSWQCSQLGRDTAANIGGEGRLLMTNPASCCWLWFRQTRRWPLAQLLLPVPVVLVLISSEFSPEGTDWAVGITHVYVWDWDSYEPLPPPLEVSIWMETDFGRMLLPPHPPPPAEQHSVGSEESQQPPPPVAELSELRAVEHRVESCGETWVVQQPDNDVGWRHGPMWTSTGISSEFICCGK